MSQMYAPQYDPQRNGGQVIFWMEQPRAYLNIIAPDLSCGLRSGNVLQHVPSVIKGQGGAEPLQLIEPPSEVACVTSARRAFFSVFFGELK